MHLNADHLKTENKNVDINMQCVPYRIGNIQHLHHTFSLVIISNTKKSAAENLKFACTLKPLPQQWQRLTL